MISGMIWFVIGFVTGVTTLAVVAVILEKS